VSFEELRSLGIENPAVLCYELDLIGVPIARVNRYVAPGRAVPVGVRIEESAAAEYAVEPKPPRWQRPLRRQPSEASEPTAARPEPLSSALPSIRRRVSEVGRLARAQLESARAKSAGLAGSEGASDAGAEGAGIAGSEGASDGGPKGAGLAGARGASAAGAKGAGLARAKGAGLAGAKGASLAAAKGASVARAKGASLAATTAPIAARAGRHRGLIALIALVAVAAAVLAIVLANQPGGSTGAGTVRAGALGHVRGALIPSGRARSRSTPAPSPRAPTGESGQLQAEGHQLLGEERYGAAIADLRTAVARSGESTARCVEPSSAACLTYAYALFDLGRALRLNGDRSAAVAALSERLQINDQRGTVQEELSRAREGGGASGPAAK
jgi:hypothetical protein